MDQLGLTITASAKTLQQGDDGSKLVCGFEPLREDVSRKALSGLLVAAAAEVAAAAPLEKEREGGREGRREGQRIKRMESRCREPERRQSLVYDPYIRIPSDLFGERQNRHAPAVHLPMPSSGRSAGIYPPPRPLPPPPALDAAGWAARDAVGGEELERGVFRLPPLGASLPSSAFELCAVSFRGRFRWSSSPSSLGRLPGRRRVAAAAVCSASLLSALSGVPSGQAAERERNDVSLKLHYCFKPSLCCFIS